MIVSDSSSLIILSEMERWDLLQNIFDDIIIPGAVYQEVTAKRDIKLPKFILVKSPEDNGLISTFKMLLDKGESEAIALAIELESDLIIDEKKGRRIAIGQGINVIGLLGIIYLNVKKGFLSENEAHEILDEVVERGFRISNRLIK